MLGGFYERRIFPLINDAAGRSSRLRRLRAELLAHATGRVLEIGFGTGANLAYYPASVASVVGIEPNEGMTERARRHLAASAVPVSVLAGIAEALPADDASVDTVVTTLTLCSVANPNQALRELRRVVRPEGRLLVLEHGLAADDVVARWQERLNPIQRVVACGCNLNRPIGVLVAGAGFQTSELRSFHLRGAPRPLGWFTVGPARPC
jgi:ubiquinone/menaquinone biosynthesis C-methylase UbiE